MSQDASSPQGFRILVILSRPLDLPDLPNLADQWALQSGLRRVQAPAFLKMLRPPTVEGLRSEILSGYDIVHFDGHGALGRRCPNCCALHSPQEKKCDRCLALLEDEEVKGYFAFEREDGLMDALAAEELAEIVTSAPQPAKLVFLSSCESAKGGEASLQNVLLAKGVPAVLGMNESVSLKATMALAGPFYAGLGAGMTIVQAFKNALPALKKMENGSKLQKIPVLEGPGKDARILPEKATGKASFETERLFGLPEHEFVGNYLRADPPRGRKGLLSQTMDALQGGEKLVVLTGQGGIGKTVLAAEAARRLACCYPGGVFWRSAADTERLGLEEMLNAFDNVFGPQLRTLPLDAKRDQVLGYLRNYNTASLLVVDNAESIRDLNLWRFLEGIPQPSAALVTTRESLPCGGREIRVPEMEQEEADRLLITQARRRSPKWGAHLSPEDLQNLNEIAGFMQGHPLAIKLTAGLMTSRSLGSIRDELRRNPPKGVSERFDVSYADLTESQKELFCRLAVFSGSVVDHAIRMVCVEDYQEGFWNWESDLGDLVRKSFIDRIEIAAQGGSGNQVLLYRYRLHLLMRQYAAEKAGNDVLTKFQTRSALCFLMYAIEFKQNFDMLERERENILAGMDFTVVRLRHEKGDKLKRASHQLLQFLCVLQDYLDIRGYWSEYRVRLHQALDAAKVLDNKNVEMACLNQLGHVSYKLGYYDDAQNFFYQCIEIADRLDDKVGKSDSLRGLGMLAQEKNEYNNAQKLFKQSHEIAKDIDDKSNISASLYQLGTLAQDANDYNEAGKLYQQSLSISQEIGDKRGISSSLGSLGILAYLTGDYKDAKKLFRHSLEISQEIGNIGNISASLHQLGMLAMGEENWDEACSFLIQSLQIKQKLGDKKGILATMGELGNLAEIKGDYDHAYSLFHDCLDIAQELQDNAGISKSLSGLGNLAYLKCDLNEARRNYQKCLEISQEIGDKNDIAISMAQFASLEETTGNVKEALRLIRQAEAAFLELKSPYAEQARKHREKLERNQ
jgi:tetratricopeptide (TPR) repeat protein